MAESLPPCDFTIVISLPGPDSSGSILKDCWNPLKSSENEKQLHILKFQSLYFKKSVIGASENGKQLRLEVFIITQWMWP